MRLATIQHPSGLTRAVIIDERRGLVEASVALAGDYPDALAVIQRHTAAEVRSSLAELPHDAFTSADDVVPVAPYSKPRMIWGIGLNYREHAADLAETAPSEEAASFIKGDHTIIGPGEPIPLPVQSNRITAEAELGLIIGRTCRNVSTADALDYVWGVVPILDQTAEDILAKNPRFLTRSKNFPGFFSFGPAIVPMDEVLERFGDIGLIEVQTRINGELHRANTVSNMTFGPAHLVSFHSEVMPLYAGDIISTGTPGAVVINGGDIAECRIDGIGTLANPVVDARESASRVSMSAQ
ncbi:fumarylacetoacetate hydrolase family protein [Diaminobutyricimonas sp. TR449]|uniref:fumarylacetoacetate hydrolase family protein n=1 Tax=Diaminobutyricimonas sp. TR449 TaxID=2708076 RepID=UPI0014249C41|nr:fumarylacetoacetate hydrolase family protein [Diaminobutyricimonas sp. TR449]